MKQLKSITLSNIRRFGRDTTIELSRGATILLAPNGTGKTAFFEAIEFGLTGKIPGSVRTCPQSFETLKPWLE